MERLEKDWVKYPILHLDLNISQYSSQKDLEDILNRNLVAWENLYGADPAERSLALRFAGIIQRACEKAGQRVVILVDEYDKPLLQNLHDETMQTELRNMLKPFYGVLKTMDGCIKFALLTGVTKFGNMSVFNDLNNLMDISMDDRYVEICGITEEEIHTYLEKELQGLASRQKVSYEEMCLELSDYWFETGTPSYLVELLKRTDYNLYDMAHTQTNAEDKQYALPFTSDTRTLFRIGVNFNNETRNIDTWKIQTT